MCAGYSILITYMYAHYSQTPIHKAVRRMYIVKARSHSAALYGLITVKTRQKVVSREADDVVDALTSSLRRATVDL